MLSRNFGGTGGRPKGEKVPEGLHWECLVDTNQPDAQPASYPFETVFAVTGRSLVGFSLATNTALRRPLSF